MKTYIALLVEKILHVKIRSASAISIWSKWRFSTLQCIIVNIHKIILSY